MTKTLTTGNNAADLVKGFTLVELLVVLSIVSVLASSISYMLINREQSFQSVTQDIVRNLRILRQQAIQHDRPYQLQIDLGNNSLHFIDTEVVLSEDVSLTVRTAENQVIDSEIAGMTFYPDASSSGGVITLENERDIFEISVVWISGKIQLRHQPRLN